MIKIILILIIISGSVFPQTVTEKWGKAEVSYLIPQKEEEKVVVNSGNLFSSAAYGFQQTYKFLISNVDGDNCPFYPSCSHFFVESVKETNPFKGYLMFIDRFTRDTNLFKNFNDYKTHKTGRLYDPAYLYTLDKNSILRNLKNETEE